MANPMGLELPVKDHAMYAKLSICDSPAAGEKNVQAHVFTSLQQTLGTYLPVPR